MANFTTLTGAKTVDGAIARWVNRSDIPVVEILTESQAWIYETLRVREMQAREVLTFAVGVQTAALPTGFLDPIQLIPYTWGSGLPLIHEGALQDVRDENGAVQEGSPSRWTIVGETATVDVLPIETFAGILHYYKQPTALSVSNETNFLTNRYPKLLRFACMAAAYEHAKDEQNAAAYYQLAAQAIGSANATNEMWRRGQYTFS